MGFFTPNVEKMYKKKDFKGIINLLVHKKPDVRASAAWHLGRSGEKNAIDPLIKALNDLNANVRSNAAESLGRIGKTKDKRAIDPLLNALKDQDEKVRCAAVEALGKIGGDTAIQSFFEVFKSDKSFNVKKKVSSFIKRFINSNKHLLKDLDASAQLSYCIINEEWGNAAKHGELAINPLIESLYNKITGAYFDLQLIVINTDTGIIAELRSEEFSDVKKKLADIELMSNILKTIDSPLLISECHKLLGHNSLTLRSIAAHILVVNNDKSFKDSFGDSVDSIEEKYKTWAVLTLERINAVNTDGLLSIICNDIIFDTINLCERLGKGKHMMAKYNIHIAELIKDAANFDFLYKTLIEDN